MSEVIRRQRFTPYCTYEIEGVEIPADLIAQLCRADGFGSAVVIYDRKLGVALEAVGLAVSSSRGSFRGTDKLRAIAAEHSIDDE